MENVMYRSNFRLVIFLSLFAVAIHVFGQTPTANYVKTETILSEDGVKTQTTVQYYDKKGRPSQLLRNGVGMDGWVRSYTEYDRWGRVEKSSMPMEAGDVPDCKDLYDLPAESSATYEGDEYGWTEYDYDAVGRETSALGPGFEWFDDSRGILRNYGVNEGNVVRRYEAPLGDECSLVNPGTYYSVGELSAMTVSDEDFKSVTHYKNRLGQTVLERRGWTGEYTDTYYVYDDLGRMRFVLSPQYQSNKQKAVTAYEYRYDKRGRIVKKILPGCEYTQYWYDTADRLLFMQDATLRERGLYRFYLYDGLGRLCVQGTCTDCNRGTYKDDVKFDRTTQGIAGTNYVHSKSWLVTNPEIEIVNYYGGYEFIDGNLMDGCPDKTTLRQTGNLNCDGNSLSVNVDTEHVHGLLTGRVVRLSDGSIRFSSMYYDYRGRLVRENDVYQDGSIVSSLSLLSFTGKKEKTLTVLTYKGHSYSVCEKNVYDHVGDKLLRTSLSVNGTTERVTSDITYDGLGRVSSVRRGSSAAPLQHTYNIRGWLKTIKSPGFEEKLFYGNYEIKDGSPYYDGSVANMSWRSSADSVWHDYVFDYDGHGRIVSASYEEGEDWIDPGEEKYSLYVDDYDLNGNIRAISRYGRKSDGTYGLTDDLSVVYAGNRLIRVNDSAERVLTSGSTDFKDIDNGNDVEYSYNGVGSLILDKNKGIDTIEYNNFNNPSMISFRLKTVLPVTVPSGGVLKEGKSVPALNHNVIRFVYTPDGEKIRTVRGLTEPFIVTGLSDGNFSSKIIYKHFFDTTEYFNRFIIRNGVAEKILFSGGYVTFSVGDKLMPVYHYYSTDHQGNVRAVYGENGTVEQTVAYDPFGVIIPDLSTNVSHQPYLYNGKELDRVHGLDWYDYGARMYDPAIMRWPAIDPMCEKFYNVSPYVYCLNNPVRFLDRDGLEPGDFFFTVDEAAVDFGLFYNGISIRRGREYASAIFSVVNKKGQAGYSYTLPNIGTEDGVMVGEAPYGYEMVARVHTHGRSSLMEDGKTEFFDNEFSGLRDTEYESRTIEYRKIVTNMTDIGNANRDKVNSYVATPNGSLQKYDYKTGEVTTISKDMPSDKRDPTRLNSVSSYNGKGDLSPEKFLHIMRKILYNDF